MALLLNVIMIASSKQEKLMNFRLAGVGRLSAVQCLSEVQFLCATQLPLDQLCIQYNKEMFLLPGQPSLFNGKWDWERGGKERVVDWVTFTDGER